MTERARFVFVFTQIRRNMSQINISHSSSSPGICPDSWLIDLSFYSEAASFRLLIAFYVNWSELYPWSKASYWLRQELKLKAKLGVVDQWPTRLICVFVERRSKIKLMIDYVAKAAASRNPTFSCIVVWLFSLLQQDTWWVVVLSSKMNITTVF